MGRFLVTGPTGQVGSYLCESLVAKGHEVLGVRGPSGRPLPRGVHAARGSWSAEGVETLIRENGTLDAVVHLAARTNIPESWKDPVGCFHVNAELSVRLVYGFAQEQPKARLVFASSSNAFGMVKTAVQDEATPLLPVSPYGVSKAAAQLAVTNVREGLGVAATSLLYFTAASSRCPPTLVLRRITSQVAAVVRGEATRVRLGTMSIVRDFCHAKDFASAAAFFALSPEAPAGDYCCASGIGRSIRAMAEVACRLGGIDPEVVLEEDPSYARPNDIPSLVGNTARLNALGWQPAVPFEDLVRECLEHDLHTP